MIVAQSYSSDAWLQELNTGGLIFIAFFALLQLILFIAALVSIIRSANYTRGGKALWALGVYAAPLLGALLWFIVGRKSTL